MRILLVNTNREMRPHPVMPIGLAYVAQALERAGHEVSVCDLSFARNPRRAIARALQAARPGMVGLSIRNLDNSSYASPHSYLAELRQIVGFCREATGAPLVIGGPAVGIAPRQLLAALQADWAVAGEGEAAAVALANSLERREAGVAFPGVLTSGAASWAPPTMDLIPPPLGNLARYVDVRPYLRRGAALPVQTRRGCRFRCVYCTYPAIEGAAYRLQEPEAVLEVMEQLRRVAGSGSFEFVDSTFNAPLPYAQRLCELLASRPRQLNLQAAGFSPAQSSPELLQAMRRAGFRTVVCSPDSAADPVLAALGKGFLRDDLERLVDQMHQAGIVTLWCFLFGGPGETEATVRETLRFIARRLSTRDLVFIAAGLRIYPGTLLERLARAEGRVTPAHDIHERHVRSLPAPFGACHTQDDLLLPHFYLSPHLSLQQLGQLFASYLPATRNLVFISDLQHSLIPWLERGLTALGVPPPLWRYGPYLRRAIPHRSRILPEQASPNR